LEGFEADCLKIGSSQGHNLALTVLYVPSSLDSGVTPILDARNWSAFPFPQWVSQIASLICMVLIENSSVKRHHTVGFVFFVLPKIGGGT